SADGRIWGRGWYFGKIVVDPKNADLVYISNTGVYRSRDGGRTVGEPFKGSPGGEGYPPLLIYPDDGDRASFRGDTGARSRADGEREVEGVGERGGGADVSRRGRRRVPVLGDRRTAGQRRRPRAHARALRRHHHARLGAVVRGRRERLHGARSAESRHRLRRN